MGSFHLFGCATFRNLYVKLLPTLHMDNMHDFSFQCATLSSQFLIRINYAGLRFNAVEPFGIQSTDTFCIRSLGPWPSVSYRSDIEEKFMSY
jgi:hypothetical protein